MILVFVEIVDRAASGRLGRLGADASPILLLVVAVVAVVVGAVIARRPPPSLVLAGLVFAAGLVTRAVALAIIPLDPLYADNLVVIERGLERLVHGSSPYAFFDLGDHVQPLRYLPWTVLSYLPAFVLGLDIRLTNVVLSLAAPLVAAVAIWRQPSAPDRRRGLVLLLAIGYVLPLVMGHDLYAEFQAFNLAVIVTFAFLIYHRPTAAAVAFGVAAGAMPVAVYFLPALLAFAARTCSPRTVLGLTAVIGIVAGGPALLFLLMDADAFLSCILYSPGVYWSRLDTGAVDWPFLLAWHHLPPVALEALHVAAMVGTVLGAAFFARTPRTTLGVAILGYLGLTLSGPYIVSHMLAVLLPMMALAEGVDFVACLRPTGTRCSPAFVERPSPAGPIHPDGSRRVASGLADRA